MKLTLAQDDSEIDWKSLARSFGTDLACSAALKVIGNHAVLVTEAEETGSTVCLRSP